MHHSEPTRCPGALSRSERHLDRAGAGSEQNRRVQIRPGGGLGNALWHLSIIYLPSLTSLPDGTSLPRSEAKG